MNEGPRHTVSGSRDTSGDGDAVITAPGAGHPQLLSEAGQLTSVGRMFAAVRAAQ